MADDYDLALQRGVVAALKADGRVAALVGGRIYDEPPHSADLGFSYVRIGGIEPRPLRTDCGAAAEVAFSVECYSRPGDGDGSGPQGRVGCARLAAAVKAALDENEVGVQVGGLTLVKLHWTGTTVDREPDGASYLGIVLFDTLIDGAPVI